ncbi:MAG: hypothetical protein IT204_02715 [Fimbriimonadaceae bacterium]|nr:hypothetical protein [Fimbriimonadaceae bacterium]
MSPPRRTLGWVFLAAAGFYLLTASYVATDGDAQGEVDELAVSGLNLRPNHLLQTVLNRAVLATWQAVGFTGLPFIPLQTLNALLGGLTVVQVLLLLSRCSGSLRLAGWGAAIFALSWAPWFHSRVAETGITPMPLLLAAVLLLLRPAAERPRYTAGWAGACLAMAALLSFNLVLLAPWLLLQVALSEPRERRLPAVAGGLLSLTLLLGGPYLVAGQAAGASTPGEFVAWLTHHPVQTEVKVGGGGLVGVARALGGLGRLWFPYSHGETALKAVLKGQEVATDPADWLTFGRNALATLLFLVLVPLGMWRSRRRPGAAMMTGAALLTGLFATQWQGSDPQFWLPVYPFLLLFGLLAVRPLAACWRRAVAPLGGLFLLLLLTANLPLWAPTPLYHRWDERWERVFRVRDRVEQRALVLVPGQSAFFGVPRYRPDVEVFDFVQRPPADLRGSAWLGWLHTQIDRAQAAGRAVYLEGLTAPLRAELLLPWQLAAATRQVDRAAAEADLAARYRLTPAPDLWDGVLRVEAR